MDESLIEKQNGNFANTLLVAAVLHNKTSGRSYKTHKKQYEYI